MKELVNPVYDGTVPIFYEGSLGDKYSELVKVQKRIERIGANRDTSPSEVLLDERGGLELEISRHLTNGEVLEDPFMDYCLRHFNGGTTHSVNNSKRREPSVFDRVSRVREFIAYVSQMDGQKILSTSGGVPLETGVISGETYFSVEGCFRHMRVLVRQLFFAESGKWSEGRSQWDAEKEKSVMINDYFSVLPDIFWHPSMLPREGVWTSDMSGIFYVGTSGNPSDDAVYVGDSNVEGALVQGYTMKSPATSKKIVMSFPGSK